MSGSGKRGGGEERVCALIYTQTTATGPLSYSTHTNNPLTHLGELGDEEEDVGHALPRDGRGGHEGDGPRQVLVLPVEL